MFAGLGFGIGLFATGLVLVFLVWVLLRLLPREQKAVSSDLPILVPPDPQQSIDAVLIIQPGGRVEYINALARQWFGLSQDEYADLERLARRVRPTDDFLKLCAVPGQKRLTVNARLLEATSYQVPGPYPLILISMRPMDLTPALATSGDSANSIIKVVSDFSQDIAASSDLLNMIRSILDNVDRIVPADMMELKVWEKTSQVLVPYQVQETASSSRQVTRIPKSNFGGLTDQLIAARQPLMLSREQIPMNGSTVKIQSYLGIPLLAGGELVGTLEAGQVSASPFGQHDIDLLKLISGQAAIAIRNSIMYQEEQRRAAELASLANLTQAVGSIQDSKDLFVRLMESVTPLFNAEIIGFLLYDDARRVLEGQVPFLGLPSQIVESYRAQIEADSPAERILLDQKPILTLDASQDENWHALGLTNVALAASLRDSALIPLASAGRMVGYLQVSHHRGGTASFSNDELRLMNIVANQAATIIDNALLVQQARRRMQRSDTLRRIASLSSSSATLDEVLKYSVQELVRLFQADIGSIFLLNEARGQLNLHRDSLWGIPDNLVGSLPQLFIGEPAYLQTVSHTQKAFVSGRLSTYQRTLSLYLFSHTLRPSEIDRSSNEQHTLSIYDSLLTPLHIESILVVPLIVRDHSVGELMLGSLAVEHFNSYDLQVISSAAGQLASAVDSASLLGQTDEALRRRADQLTAIARASRELIATLDIHRLLDVIHDETLRITRADCGAILLFDSMAQAEGLNVELSIGCQLSEDISYLDRKVLEMGESIVVNDFNSSGGQPPHEDVRSALVVPIKQQNRILGVIHLHASLPSFFDSD
ncbi:MAG TPA: GAF domain-containing protein, partial [Anaerolineales bacterium]|nr:GAF domain-containing protein [Anaerolineales bacterium]